MPTENEYKFPLVIESEPEIIRESIRKFGIKQGYINNGDIRVRMTQLYNSKNEIYSFNTLLAFKKFVSNRLIEIEPIISERDFTDLWSIAENKVEKYRYVLENNWVADYFYENNLCYFALSEVELPEGDERPKDIIDVVKKNLTKYSIDDREITSYKLSNVEYARKIYKQLTCGE